MNEQEYTNSQLLNAYLDGELDSLREALLFRQLADEQDLRTEMRESLALRNYVQRDADSLHPPAALKARVLAAVQNSEARSAAVPAPQALHRRWYAMLLPVLGALGGALLTLLLLPDAHTGLGEKPAHGVPAADSGERDVPRHAYARISMDAPDAPEIPPPASARLAEDGRQAIRQGAAARADVAHRAQTPAVHRSPVQAALPGSAMLHTAPLRAVAANDRDTPALRLQSPAAVPISQVVSGLSEMTAERFHLSMRHTAGRSIPEVATATKSEPWFQDISLGLLYALDEHHSLGVEFGQEHFSQRYSGVLDGRNARHEQKPLLVWLGAAYQYKADRWESLGGVQPFGRALLAGTATGPLLKGMLGLQWQPESRVHFLLGFEGAYLPYRHQGRWFDSRKIGITYGITLGL